MHKCRGLAILFAAILTVNGYAAHIMQWKVGIGKEWRWQNDTAQPVYAQLVLLRGAVSVKTAKQVFLLTQDNIYSLVINLQPNENIDLVVDFINGYQASGYVEFINYS